MKILWLSHNIPYPPNRGALERNYYLLREIANRAEVSLLAFNQQKILATNTEVTEAVQALQKFCVLVQAVDIPSDESFLSWCKLVVKSIFTKDPYTANWLKADVMHRKVIEITSRESFDLVHFDTISLCPYVDDTESIPKILNHHNIESVRMNRKADAEKNPIKRLYLKQEAVKLFTYEQHIAGKFKAHTVVSEVDREILKRFTDGINIEVIENGVDIEYFKPPETDRTVNGRLVFVGSMDRGANIDAMYFFYKSILPLLKKEIPDVSLTIVGHNPSAGLSKLVEADPAIRLTGSVPDIRSYCHEASVFICPLRDGGGTKLKVLDAMAMSLPIVTTDIGCEGIKASHEKEVLIANTPEDFSRQVIRLLRDKKLRREMGTSARKLIEREYSWKSIGVHLYKVYESVS